MTQRAIVVSGAGRYADPWHPFAQTSARLADIATDAGFDASVDEDVDARLADLRGVDLLIVNVGATGPRDEHGAPLPTPSEVTDLAGIARDATTRDGMLAHLAAGKPLLALHVSATSFGFLPEWEAVLGGIWVRGTTMHPPLDAARIRVYGDRHDIVRGMDDFTLEDERYSHLRVADEIVPLATHEHDGIEHPVLWARRYGTARVVYDALGHDGRSYDSPEHREILTRAMRWLAA